MPAVKSHGKVIVYLCSRISGRTIKKEKSALLFPKKGEEEEAGSLSFPRYNMYYEDK